MSTVQFANGATVEFQGTPTPADIEEVSKTPGVANYQKGGFGQKVLSTLGDIANAVEKPWVSLAAIPLQTGLAAYNKLTGSNVADPFSDFTGTFGGKSENIPGVSSGGDLLRKVGDVGQVATQIAAVTPTGLAASVARPVLTNTALGAASGLSASVSAGNQDLEQLTKDTIYGGLWGAAVGVLQKGLQSGRGLLKGNTGVTPQMETEIKTTDPALISKYVDTTVGHGKNIRVLSPDALADNALEQRVNILTKQVIPKAGEAVGQAKKMAGKLPVSIFPENASAPLVREAAVDHVSDSINDVMQNMTGHEFSAYSSGGGDALEILNYKVGASPIGLNTPGGSEIAKIAGRSVELSNTEMKQLENLGKELLKLRENPMIQTASDVLINIDNDIGKWNTPQLGASAGNSPVQGVLKFARGAINRIIAPSSPELAKANSIYSGLMDLREELGVAAGKDIQSGSLLMRRVFSGDKGGDAVGLLDKVGTLTQAFMPKGDNSTLLQHAVLAEFAKKNFGDYTTRTLMGQRVAEASGFFGYPRAIVRNLMKEGLTAMTPGAERYATALAQGNDVSFFPGAHFIDDFVDSAKSKPATEAIAKSLEGMGFSSSNIMKVAGNVLRLMLLNRLSQPSSTPAPQNTLPQSTPMLSQPQQPAGGPTSQIQSTPLSQAATQRNVSSINSLSMPRTGQAMARTLKQAPGPGKLSLTSNLG